MSLQERLTSAETSTSPGTNINGATLFKTSSNGQGTRSATQAAATSGVFMSHKEPPIYRGTLDQFSKFDTTPNTGTEFPDANLAEWLRAPNSDDLIRDLAITGKAADLPPKVSRRGVVFFRAQNDMTVELQKELAQRMGLLTGKPPTSGLHIFPLMHTTKQIDDKEVTVISDQGGKPKDAKEAAAKPRLRLQDPSVTPIHKMWHTDSQFENIPGDYAVLRMVELPRTGGDTVWASGYDVYDRLSPPMRAFLSTLTFTAGQKEKYEAIAAANGLAWYTDPRGAPENVGKDVMATHPVIRTNPVSGWNTVYCLGHHVQRINGLSQVESGKIVDWLHETVVLNHDIHVRHRWVNENDIAIWDNQCMVHTATPDYLGKGLGDRRGFRALGIRDRPYFDLEAVGREEGLAREAAE